MIEQATIRVFEGLERYRERGLRMFVSSSFQTHSIPLLHLVSRFDASIPVFFLETGFHFPETRMFRDAVAEQLGLNVVSLESPIQKLAQRDAQGRFLFASDPDECCYLNKVLPLEPVLQAHDVWIAGVRRDQTRFRRDLADEVKGRHGTVKFHPMLDWTSKMVWEYRKAHDLPEHPLEASGYLSVGCIPCTRSWGEESAERGGRWA
ncbi:MAG: phosphoadenylyl-sulfate reductase, partial [Xanthomonadales bacterium]|nr:phosphoadenylyl-sulfate reductase [Xanthomonadales bacterium]